MLIMASHDGTPPKACITGCPPDKNSRSGFLEREYLIGMN